MRMQVVRGHSKHFPSFANVCQVNTAHRDMSYQDTGCVLRIMLTGDVGRPCRRNGQAARSTGSVKHGIILGIREVGPVLTLLQAYDGMGTTTAVDLPNEVGTCNP